MTAEAIVAALAGLVAGAVLGALVVWARSRRQAAPARTARRILMPFSGPAISRRALDAVLRLARAEDATLVPAYLMTVPLMMPLNCALPRQADYAMALLETIEQRAGALGVPVDARIERGRTVRDAMPRLFDSERFDRVVIPAKSSVGDRGSTARTSRGRSSGPRARCSSYARPPRTARR
jgi:nucleotide-binding universal stress UspA family protein